MSFRPGSLLPGTCLLESGTQQKLLFYRAAHIEDQMLNAFDRQLGFIGFFDVLASKTLDVRVSPFCMTIYASRKADSI